MQFEVQHICVLLCYMNSLLHSFTENYIVGIYSVCWISIWPSSEDYIAIYYILYRPNISQISGLFYIYTSVLPGIMGFPASNSPNMQPVLHRSTDTPYSVAPRRSSGGRYHKVTTRLVIGFNLLGSNNVARPKSPILSVPLLSIRRLEPLMSRCSTPCVWQWYKPWSNCCMKHFICSGSSKF